MRDGIVGGPAGPSIPFYALFNGAGVRHQLSPFLLAAFAKQESNFDPNVVSYDAGHGLMQLTSSWPENWADPVANIDYACANFIVPAYTYWQAQGMRGDDLIRCVGATYNAGLGSAIRHHNQGDVDAGSTNRYGERLVENYHSLLAR